MGPRSEGLRTHVLGTQSEAELAPSALHRLPGMSGTLMLVLTFIASAVANRVANRVLLVPPRVFAVQERRQKSATTRFRWPGIPSSSLLQQALRSSRLGSERKEKGRTGSSSLAFEADCLLAASRLEGVEATRNKHASELFAVGWGGPSVPRSFALSVSGLNKALRSIT